MQLNLIPSSSELPLPTSLVAPEFSAGPVHEACACHVGFGINHKKDKRNTGVRQWVFALEELTSSLFQRPSSNSASPLTLDHRLVFQSRKPAVHRKESAHFHGKSRCRQPENFVPSAPRLLSRGASTASACVPAQPQSGESGRGRLSAAVGPGKQPHVRGGGDASLIGEARWRGGPPLDSAAGPPPPRPLSTFCRGTATGRGGVTTLSEQGRPAGRFARRGV